MTVSEFCGQSKAVLEAHLSAVEVTGEISRLVKHTSGHWYFTLKDEGASVETAMFRSVNATVKFNVQDGMKVTIFGMATIYGGKFQLKAIRMRPSGEGELELAFRQLCERLRSEGLFETCYKKPLPRFPARVALVTSLTSAAYQDLRRVILNRGWFATTFDAFNTLVQGERAAKNMCEVLTRVDKFGYDAIVLARGGGSKEDLWAFNDEGLARVIFGLETPIISAVGHEIDTSISDLVADHRSLTPTAAMVDLLPDANEVRFALDAFADGFVRCVGQKLRSVEMRLASAGSNLRARSVGVRVRNSQVWLNSCEERLCGVLRGRFFACEERLKAHQNRLHSRLVVSRVANYQERLNALFTAFRARAGERVFACERGLNLRLGRFGVEALRGRVGEGERRLFLLEANLRQAFGERVRAGEARLVASETLLGARREFLKSVKGFVQVYKDGKRVRLSEVKSGDEVVLSAVDATKRAVVK